MKSKYFIVIFLLTLVSTISPKVSMAASQDECAIWLCMPAGFPGSECNAPHNAMIKRIKKGKSPLPSFGSCAVDSPQSGNIGTNEGYAAFYYDRVKCTREHNDYGCVAFKELPNKIVNESRCKKEPYTDAYRSQCKSISFVQTIIDGKPWGEAVYYDSNGNIYNPNDF
ncbi:hypothetical protein ACKWMY_24800 [Serratia sp. J2]|uniref:hypothetical protein n=1 Tax=Serratia sp. J2 TaxID=3386551 RepID=UPI003916CFE7